MPRYAIVEAPSALGHIPEHLGVGAVGYSSERDPQTKVMNPPGDQRLRLYIDGDADFYQPDVNPRRGAASASEAVRYLMREGGPQDGFWIHIDADVFDETIMQAVDDPRPDGLDWNEVVSALSASADA